MQRVLWIVLALVWVHLFLYVVFADHGLVGVRHVSVRYESLRQENRGWIRQNLTLERHINRLRQDPVYIEQSARTELGMVRPSDLVFHFNQRLSETDDTGPLAVRQPVGDR